MLKNKRIFISGGAGVIGTALVKKLSQFGNHLFVGDLKPKPKDFPENVKYRQGDLNSITKEEIEEFDPQYFFHLAATFERAEESYEFWDENFEHNISLSNHLMTLLKKSMSLEKVIFASSYLIYNPKLYTVKNKPKDATRLNENDSIYPRNTCGSAKLFHENQLKFLEQFKHTKFSTISARIFRVYGKNSKDIVSRWIRSLLKDEEIVVYNQENQFDYIYADDVAEGLIRLAESSISGIINLGNDKSRSINELLNILKEHFPKMKSKFVDYGYLYEASQANMEKFVTEIGWKPSRQLEDNISEIIEFEKNRMSSYEETSTNFNILVTSISKKIPQLKLIRQANERLGNHGKIFGADTNKDCIGKYFVDSFWQIPNYEKITIEEVIAYCKENKILGIIPTSDGELLFYAQNKKKLEDEKINVMVSNGDNISICVDKIEFFKKLKNLQFPVITTSENIEDIKAEHYVIKERVANFGTQSNELKILKDEAIKSSTKFKNPIFQPFIEGKEFSIDLYVDKKSNPKGCIIRTREMIQNGESQITQSIENKELEEMCLSLIEKLNLYGHVIMQVIVDNENKFNVLECNNRFGGASSLSSEMGLDTFYWFLLETTGANIDKYPFVRSHHHKKQIRYPDNLILF